MKTLAFLQNMWVKDPERVKAMVQRNGEEFRRQFMEFALFRGCLTGRRIKAAFGGLCDDIIWEETTREIAGDPKTIFPADIDHMIDSIRTHQPEIVVTFGLIAWNAVCAVQEKSQCLARAHFVRAMHPTARHPNIIQNLNEAAAQLRRLRVGDYKGEPLNERMSDEV